MIVRIVLAATSAFVAAMVIALGSASAGGFSTVGLTSPPPRDVDAGQAWEARFTVLVHGRSPLAGLDPVVQIERTGGGEPRTFRATETSAPGTYRARVVFPVEGRWAIEVVEHEAMAGVPFAGHSFGTVDVGSPAPTASTGSPGGARSSLAALAIAVALGVSVGGGAWLVQAKLAASRSAAAG
jgi:hypothetical protein